MLGSIRTGVAAGIAVLFGIAGVFYSLAGAAETRAGQASVVEFTPDGKMKRPEGYRERIYIGTRHAPSSTRSWPACAPKVSSTTTDASSAWMISPVWRRSPSPERNRRNFPGCHPDDIAKTRCG